MNEKKEMKKRKFIDDWLKDPVFNGWLAKVKDNKTQARCSICHKTIELSTSGRSALTDHAKGRKHIETEQKRKKFFQPKSSKSSSASPAPSLEPSTSETLTVKDGQRTLDDILSQTNSTTAEIIWILKCIMSGVSVRFNDDIVETLKAMFPELNNLKDFSLGRTKSMYVINHGLAPYFKALLIDTLGKSKIHAYCFDESLNESTQSSEMDLYVRFWDDLEKRVKVRYLGSSFLGHCKSNDLMDHFTKLTDVLKSEHLYQISMDGPNVNKKFYKDFSTNFEEGNFHKLVDIGTCSLHIVHGAFKTGVEKSGWPLKKFLKGGYILLHNTPARREDYESVTGSTTYPLSFCVIR